VNGEYRECNRKILWLQEVTSERSPCHEVFEDYTFYRCNLYQASLQEVISSLMSKLMCKEDLEALSKQGGYDSQSVLDSRNR
jgi:hypothetical protein